MFSISHNFIQGIVGRSSRFGLATAVIGTLTIAGCQQEQSQPKALELLPSANVSWLDATNRNAQSRQLKGAVWQAQLLDDGRAMLVERQPDNAARAERLQIEFADMLADEFCLYASPISDNLYAFVQDGRARSEQWLLAERGKLLNDAIKVRQLPVGYDTSLCVVDDRRGHLYMTEEAVGVWRYHAEPETMTERQPVAMEQPWGTLQGKVEAMSWLSDGRLALLTSDELQLLSTESSDFSGPMTVARWPFDVAVNNGHDQVEFERMWWSDTDTGQLTVALGNDDVAEVWTGQLAKDQTLLAAYQQAGMDAIAEVQPSYQTAPAEQTGDAMDDPAIWFNPNRAAHSLVLGTHKKHGLYVYDLQGNTLQVLADGQLNNVDVRSLEQPIGPYYGIASASRRDDNTVVLYGIRADRKVIKLAKFETPLSKIYGICMGFVEGQLAVFPNDKDGRVLHYQVGTDQTAQSWQPKLMQTFKLGSQPEGCVVDDVRQQLFVGEEDVGVWMMPLNQDDANWQAIAQVGQQLHADVEGVAIARGEPDLLVVSSQGNDSYVLYQASFPYEYVGRFRVGLNAEKGIDGSSETDGLDVLTMPLNTDFPNGVLVVQDGRNLMPDQPQNFKFVSWANVLDRLRTADQQ
ncbi:phytase [Neiella sp. HB171785]|uniref:Phytase n=1 Tax=Neiella litorisoli TaxID=2771431 RepID=A0A8J6QIS9_9GAMM|nr:phytase [Neiella litorisoli]MBD1388871.1 phytase [Neiella litorisoli]